jgi:hypothetical protein
MEGIMEEEWRPVPSCPGMLASSLGFIKLPETTVVLRSGVVRTYKTKPVLGVKTRSSKTARHCYYGIRTQSFGQKKIHRLICEAFYGPPPFPNAVVIHLDENAMNNRADNLRWGTQKENLNMPGFTSYCRERTGEKSAWAKHRRKRADE